MYRQNLKSVIRYWNFGWELRTHYLGEEKSVGGGDGAVRKSVGEFL